MVLELQHNLDNAQLTVHEQAANRQYLQPEFVEEDSPEGSSARIRCDGCAHSAHLYRKSRNNPSEKVVATRM
ncbi:hypothetical protein PG987_013584 [Apiospora arundinis]